MKATTRIVSWCRRMLPALTLTVLVGCTNQPTSPDTPAGTPASRNADDLLIVDCLLPSQVRRLGLKFTYLTPQRPAKLPASECAIRGGDYVSYDRANFATSLKVWLEPAEQGDAEAQTYVGEIFEKGLGQEADYEVAAAWYRRAAESGYSRALINLGYLHEVGLGVEQDLALAMNYYRQASGITDGELEYVSTAEYARREASKKLSEDTIADLSAQVNALTGQLQVKQADLDRDRREIQQLQQQVSQARQTVASEQPSDSATAQIEKVKKQLEIAQTEQQRLTLKIAQQQKLTAAARKESIASQSQVDELNDSLRRRENRIAFLEKQIADSPSTQPQFAAELDTQRREATSIRREMETLDTNANNAGNAQLAAALETENKLKSDLAERNTTIGQLQAQIETLEADYLSRIRLLNENLERSQQQQQLSQSRIDEVLAEREQLQLDLTESQQRLKSRSAERDVLQNKLAQLTESAQASSEVSELQTQLLQKEKQLQLAQTEQRRLSTKLIDNELTLAQNRQSTGELQAGIQQREALVDSQQQQIAELEQQVADYRARVNQTDDQTGSLAQALAVNEKALAVSRQEQRGLRDKLLDLKLTLSEQVADANSRADRFAALADERSEIVEQQQRDITNLEQEVDRLNTAIRTTSNTAERDQLRAELERNEKAVEIAREEQKRLSAKLLQVQLASSQKLKQTIGKLSESEEQLKARTRELQQKESEVTRLESDVAALRVKLDSNADNRSQSVVAVGPAIEIISPQQLVTRGQVTLPHPGGGGRMEITGKVSPASDVFSLNINSTPVRFNSVGLFKYEHDLSAGDKISMIAVDNQAQRNMVELNVTPRPSRSAGNGNARPPSEPRDNTRYLSAARSVNFGNYHALIIGNFDYQHRASLSTVENDVVEIERLLRTRYGYSTELLLNATREELLFSLNRQYQSLTSKDNLLIYYAGHGELDDAGNKGYWLPVDALPNDSSNWISNDVITDIISSMKARHVMVVADSCYSGTLTKTSIRGGLDFVEQELTPDWFQLNASLKARVVMTSGGVKPVFDALGNSSNSIFAKALIGELQSNKGALSGNQLFRAVQQQVEFEASQFNVQQSPQYSPIKNACHEISEYFFIPET